MINSFVSLIHGVLDWFYPPFKRVMPLQTFRYAACGGGNTLLDICLFHISHTYILEEQYLQIPWITLSPHIAAFLMSFVVTFPLGFFLNRYVVFEGREVRKREQLPKYMGVVIVAILLNYFFLKVFVETFGMDATLAKVVTTFFVVAFSYYSQKHFTFK
ncbi:MAG TPA: GtrA family protein [Lacibacter sp.]|nr:GtrA family protein [Lacibacter sp.]